MTRSAIGTSIGIAALAVALGGCDQLRDAAGLGDGSNASAVANTSAGSATNLAAPDGAKPPAPAAANPALAAEMRTAAEQLSASLPMRVNDVTTLTAFRAEGTEYIYDMAVSRDIAPAEIDKARQTIQANNQANLCRDPNTSRLIAMGGTMTHRYTDPNGDGFETRVTACPG